MNSGTIGRIELETCDSRQFRRISQEDMVSDLSISFRCFGLGVLGMYEYQ